MGCASSRSRSHTPESHSAYLIATSILNFLIERSVSTRGSSGRGLRRHDAVVNRGRSRRAVADGVAAALVARRDQYPTGRANCNRSEIKVPAVSRHRHKGSLRCGHGLIVAGAVFKRGTALGLASATQRDYGLTGMSVLMNLRFILSVPGNCILVT